MIMQQIKKWFGLGPAKAAADLSQPVTQPTLQHAYTADTAPTEVSARPIAVTVMGQDTAPKPRTSRPRAVKAAAAPKAAAAAKARVSTKTAKTAAKGSAKAKT